MGQWNVGTCSRLVLSFVLSSSEVLIVNTNETTMGYVILKNDVWHLLEEALK